MKIYPIPLDDIAMKNTIVKKSLVFCKSMVILLLGFKKSKDEKKNDPKK
jgi:hypothetical protein